MEDKDLIRLEAKKENIKKYIDRLYATTSVNSESNTTEELVKEAKKIGVEELTKMANELDIFGKCVFHYRLPIDMRLNVDFSKATEVPEEERKAYWKDYRLKLSKKNLNPEEEYNKIILMACTLHVPIKEEEPANFIDMTSDSNNDEQNKAENDDSKDNNLDSKQHEEVLSDVEKIE